MRCCDSNMGEAKRNRIASVIGCNEKFILPLKCQRDKCPIQDHRNW